MLAATAAAADQSVELGAYQVVSDAHAVRHVELRPRERLGQLGARELLSVAERLLDRGIASAKMLLVELVSPPLVRTREPHARRRELEHPADVLRCDEVPRRPQDVRAEDRALVERAVDRRIRRTDESLREIPLRRSVVLRLYRTESRDDLRGRGQRLSDEMLAGETLPNEVAHYSREGGMA